MKKYITKIIIVVLLVSGLSVTQQCETTELDLTKNPNALSPDQADPNLLLNRIQVDFGFLVESFGRTGAEVTRIDYMFGRNYRNNYNPASFDVEWLDAYAGILADIREMTPLAQESSSYDHLGIAQFIEAYTLITLVDFFGDIPYSQAIMGRENLNPQVDSGADVYAAALSLLEQAESSFNADVDASTIPPQDFFYGNDEDNWVRAINTLRMKIYMQTRLVDGSALSNFDAIVNSGNYIQDTSQDLQFSYGTNEVQPDTRHPKYIGSYTATGGEDYMSNWLMNYMDTTSDPRIRYYYYRQEPAVPGQEIDPNEETLDCSLQTDPAHYVAGRFTFCNLPNGYWGRDHGNDFGTPPDGFLRTIAGVYPCAGSFDDSSFAGKRQGDGGGGAGITPILLASTVDFLIAEAALVGGDVATAKTSILEGLSKSVNKVSVFGALDTEADLTFAPDATDIMSHSSTVGTSFDNADTTGKWNILAEQFFISLYGNGIDAYNFYRRTGFPQTLQPSLEPDPGSFIRSFFYPSNFVNSNSSVSQKPDVVQQVFWDNNPASPGFPVSN